MEDYKKLGWKKYHLKSKPSRWLTIVAIVLLVLLGLVIAKQVAGLHGEIEELSAYTQQAGRQAGSSSTDSPALTDPCSLRFVICNLQK